MKIRYIGLLIALFSLMNCKKEYSYEGGIADFTFVGLNGHCLNYVVSGTYQPGLELTGSAQVALKVSVNHIGKYAFQTNTEDGILFAAEGAFTVTGVQTIIMYGKGRPTALGTFSFTPNLPDFCEFSVSVQDKAVLHADYTLTGAPGVCTATKLNGNFTQGTAMTIANTVLINVNVLSVGEYTITSDTLNGIWFSSTGYFNQTGPQPVTLSASGTPVDPRFITFTTTGNGSSCAFEMTVEGSGPPATYVLESGQQVTDVCQGTLNGNYTAGQPLTAADTFIEHVFVTGLGNYTVSTANINGMVFYVTGTFTSLGEQTITLTGSGTPLASGSFILTPHIIGPAPIGGASCDILMDVQ